ncbi:hypothetical protein ACFQ3P_32745 [Paraburkholderia sabiae]|uniref:Uncharacterized protein n=1 Tax=Paraburkholderia sabiae TaxID=273251 RepID=A0ABU9QIZ2_9BURK|nr:hypothetical protein [Paraburkholderia sabiae]WJZ80028.1 hypothetical protein QEN71_43570 [Paraburkholderia sabiae]CAD6559466.1 hypothetical protein LMG24235_06684 [Paraburkholderia sabiae]
MFLFYLIDPVSRSIEKVRDGFDRAAELTNSDAPEIDTLWEDASDPDSSVDVAYNPDAGGQPVFRLRLLHGGNTTERVVAGRSVLMACGAVPDDIAQQVATTEAVQAAIHFAGGRTNIAEWLKAGAPDARAPARRSASFDHPRKYRHSTTGRR